MGNEASQGSMDQVKELKNYEQVSRTGEGVIYRKRVMGSEQQTAEYFMLKEHNYHSHESYQLAFRKYEQSLQLSHQGQSNTLGVKQVVKQQIQHFCSNTYKIFALYEYPELTLRDEIQVRARENKYFEECQVVAILQTCVLALEEIRATICFASNLIYISPDGVIKVTHNDLVDENYRHVVTPGTYYAPQKLTNFMTESSSQTGLKKEIIFSMGMTLLEACNLQSIHDVYDYSGQKINSQKLSGYIESLSQKYSTQLIDLLTNMLEPNPNRRISLLQVQRSLNELDQAQNQKLNEEESQSNRQEMEQKCDKFFANETHHLPGIKESNQSYEEPSIPNLLSHQNSSRVSLSKNYHSKGTTNTNEEFYHNIDKSMEGYKITCNLGANSLTHQNNMTAQFAQPIFPAPAPKTPSTDHIFTDPKLLQMIRKDLEEINKSRTSRIMMSSKHQLKNSWVNNSQNFIENSATNRNKNQTGYEGKNNENVALSAFEKEPVFDRYANSNKSFTEYTTLHNCPQVESLAASVARDNLSGQKQNSYVYEQSEVKRHPRETLQGEKQRMKVSVALSSKNFGQATNHQSTPSTVRYPLREMSSNNMKDPSDFSSVEFELKSAMMKKKEPNLIYLEEVYEDGVKYEGMSKNGMKEGYGKLLYNDGAYYEGYFHNDKINGKGALYYKKNCPAYDGEWLDEQFNGYGQLYNEQPQELHEEFPYHNWNFLENYWVKYEGEFLNDNKHGKGKIILTSDQYIEGLFADDMLNGWARFYKQNGDCIEGRYENNILVQLKNQQ